MHQRCLLWRSLQRAWSEVLHRRMHQRYLLSRSLQRAWSEVQPRAWLEEQPRGMTMMANDNRDKDVDNDGDYGDNHYKDVVDILCVVLL